MENKIKAQISYSQSYTGNEYYIWLGFLNVCLPHIFICVPYSIFIALQKDKVKKAKLFVSKTNEGKYYLQLKKFKYLFFKKYKIEISKRQYEYLT